MTSSIQIGANMAAQRATRALARAQSVQEASFERLASGMRINRAADDAAGLAVATTLNTDSRVFGQAVRNLNDGLSTLAVAEGALRALSLVVTRQRELAEQAANGVYSLAQRESMHDEADALVSEFNRIVESTSFNNVRLLNGSSTTLRLQAGFGLDGGILAGIGTQFGRRIGTGSFQSQVIYEAQNSQETIIADFNGDGRNDIISGGGVTLTDSAIQVLIGNGDGTFLAPVSYYSGRSGLGPLTFGDVNNDGRLDVIAFNGDDGRAVTYLGNGNGTFRFGGTYATGSGNKNGEVADLNRDGFLDIVAVNESDGTLSILIGNGNGTFRAQSSFAGFASIDDVKISDLNLDGTLDLVFSGGGTVYSMLGDGRGNFSGTQTFAIGGDNVSIAVGDFNRDGYIDAVTSSLGSSGYFALLVGNGDGSFKSVATLSTGGIGATDGIVVGDFNNDGLLDVGGGSYEKDNLIAFGNGDGSFTVARSTGVNSGSTRTSVGDLNGDGVLDFVRSLTGSNQLGVSLQSTSVGYNAERLYLLTAQGSREALDTTERALLRLSLELGSVGASQARLQVAANTLFTSRQETSAAESRIRDVDVAQEAAANVRSGILMRTAAAVLAQANQQPALALQLLRG